MASTMYAYFNFKATNQVPGRGLTAKPAVDRDILPGATPRVLYPFEVSHHLRRCGPRVHSAVLGSMTVFTSEIRLAGKPPC